MSAPFDPAPVAFKTLVTDPELLDALEQRGYERTTPIQSAVLPYALAGRDLIGCAETGTGKTAAYLLPILPASSANIERRAGGARRDARAHPRADARTGDAD